jgi:CrcB protein
MERVILVGLGGLVGSLARYGLGGALNRIKIGAAFPYETLVVNAAGWLANGALAGLGEARGVFGGSSRAFLFVGVLGGFTTFSTFGYETFQLLRDGQAGTAALSAALQIALGIGGVWAGDAVVRALWTN